MSIEEPFSILPLDVLWWAAARCAGAGSGPPGWARGSPLGLCFRRAHHTSSPLLSCLRAHCPALPRPGCSDTIEANVRELRSTHRQAHGARSSEKQQAPPARDVVQEAVMEAAASAGQ